MVNNQSIEKQILQTIVNNLVDGFLKKEFKGLKIITSDDISHSRFYCVLLINNLAFNLICRNKDDFIVEISSTIRIDNEGKEHFVIFDQTGLCVNSISTIIDFNDPSMIEKVIGYIKEKLNEVENAKLRKHSV